MYKYMKRLVLLYLIIIALFNNTIQGQTSNNLLSGNKHVAVFVYCDETVSTPINALRAKLTSTLINGDKSTYDVVDRTDDILNVLKEEYKYQGTGLVKDEQLVSVGEHLGANYICVVNVTHYSEYNQFFFECRLVNVETRKIEMQTFYPDDNQTIISILTPQKQLEVAENLASSFGLLSQSSKALKVGDDYGMTHELSSGQRLRYRIGYLDNTNKHGIAFVVLPGKSNSPRGPSLAQLKILYQNKETLGLYGEYWSSDGAGKNHYYTLDFSTGRTLSREVKNGFSTPPEYRREVILIHTF